ncbi:hypothetical protein TraAM80_03126 [Trypanosoma rangeli]|uniref:Uncharacterized protein n=1 Tax=Trypanosoma rangeli TaxID=5698 RepID=A0A3R7KHP0_TRYRA|nr:uncharacterized protein TraAM80_03126 [Trypanosoma rangeli]RNF07868.1 hypothetical protein TraAM80_03126 [Trypanosoma rangeli]|eukprot:RNF07868.1 hypothetical protein TraAM80_03126 [Trypanosoma rangeli]
MVLTLAQLIFPRRHPRGTLSRVTPLQDDVTTLSPSPLKADSFTDRLPFWRRLLCAPELPDMSLQASSASLQRGAAHVSSSRAPSIVTSGPESKVTSAAIANRGKDGSLRATKSVFAGPLQRAAHADNDGCVRSDSFFSAGAASVPSSRWMVSDTRRMHTKAEASPNSCSSPTSPLPRFGSSSTRLQLKHARSEQMKMEARQRKELQRDEVALWTEEKQRRLGALVQDETCDAPSSPSQSVTLSGEVLAQHKAETDENADVYGLVNSCVVSMEETDDESSYIEGDDAIDLQDLNRLYDYYKRRDRTVAASEQEGAVTDAAVVAVPGTDKPKRARCYELSSRKYIERVVLAQRSQQTIALLWLLAESMRHAWKLQYRLAQLYVNYVPFYLQAGGGVVGNGEESHLWDITESKYYTYFCSGTFDYEYYMYQFSQKWETLFGDVQHYLCDDATGHAGSVGVAATLLYSMDLFERQHELQVAVREVEQWLQARWKRISEAAALVSSSTPITTEMGATHSRSSSSIGEGTSTTVTRGDAAHAGDGDECGSKEEGSPQLVLANPVGIALQAVNQNEQEMTYIPIDWWSAQDADIRAHVSWNRRKQKFRQISLGMAALRKTNPLEFPDSIVNNTQDPAPQLQTWLPGMLEPIVVDDIEEEAHSHHVVNVGCFGFSFFSRWD